MNEAVDLPKDIAAAITLSVQLSQHRSLVFQTYMPRDAGVQEFHGLLDKLGASADRQEAKGRLIDLEAELKMATKMIRQHQEDFQRIEVANEAFWKGKKGPPKLSPQETQARDQAKISVSRYKEEIARIEGEMAKAQHIVQGAV